MAFSITLCKSRIFLSTLLGATAITGDLLVKRSVTDVGKAFCDNLTHGAIGGLSWFIVALNYDTKYGLLDTILCAIVSCGIDVDHFFAAHSFSIKDAVRLSSRPFLHCTTPPVISCLLMLLFTNILQLSAALHATLQRILWVLIVAFLSHHIRDGNRRGLWLWPLPFMNKNTQYSTPPLPKALYLCLIVFLPHLVAFLMFSFGGYSFTPRKTYVHIV